jgi:hypothetical protein
LIIAGGMMVFVTIMAFYDFKICEFGILKAKLDPYWMTVPAKGERGL